MTLNVLRVLSGGCWDITTVGTAKKMANPEISVPVLSVETENACITSAGAEVGSDTIQAPLLVSSSDSSKTIPTAAHQWSSLQAPSVKLLHQKEQTSGVESECGMRRNDSYTMFGHMETVSLDVSEQELLQVANASVTNEASSLILDPAGEVMPTMNAAHGDPMGGEESEMNLSKYFSIPAHVSNAIPGNGLEFFDALSSAPPVGPKKPSREQPPDRKLSTEVNSNSSSQGVEAEFPNTNLQDVFTESEEWTKTQVTECMMPVGGPNAPDTSAQAKMEQPDISKYFSQNTCGVRTTGKTFFDVIAESKETSLPAAGGNPSLDVTPNETLFNSDINSVSNSNSESSFLSSVTSPCNDQMYDAWIPSEKTRQILVTMATSTPGSYFPEKEYMTMPGIIIEEDMADPVITLLKEANSPMAEERKALTVSDVSQDEEGLKKLIKTGCYHAAVNLTTRLLTAAGQGPGQGGHLTKHTPYSLQLWFTRLSLLVKLTKFSLVEVESEAFGDLDKADLYYDFYPDIYAGKKGTMVPFSFRLLLAELPQYQGNHQAALDNLYHILTFVQKIILNLQNDCAEDGSMIELTTSRRKASLELWTKRECRVLYSILNCVLSQRDYVMAVSVTKILIKKDSDYVLQLYSALGRIYLQLGDVRAAQESFNRASSPEVKAQGDKASQAQEFVNNVTMLAVCTKEEQRAVIRFLCSEGVPGVEVHQRLTTQYEDSALPRALLAVAHNEYEEAYKFFQKAYNLQPENAMLANNIAVCLLYLGRLKQSLAMLEQTVQSRPNECLHDGILFNTCTLYELESSRSTIKKFAMLNLVSTHAGDNFNVSCLKISTSSKS